MKKLLCMLLVFILCGCNYSVLAGDYFYDMMVVYRLIMMDKGAPPVDANVSENQLSVVLEDVYFTTMDSMEYFYPEHIKQETVFTLLLPDGDSYKYSGTPVVPEVEVNTSLYGPGTWMKNYDLLSIGDVVYENNNALGTATVSVRINVVGDATYTLSTTFMITDEAGKRIPGDVSGDDSVNIDDVICLLDYLCDSPGGIHQTNADVNGDGKVDLHDVLLILQYLAGWNVSLT